MLTKYAEFEVIDSTLVPENVGHQRLARLRRQAHRHHFEYEPRPGYLYVRSRAISSRSNDNHDMFPAEEIKKAYRTFIGKPVFVNHHNSDHRRARGVIIDAALHEDTNPDGTEDTWTEVLMEVDAVRFPLLAEAVRRGDIARTSMGTDVAYSECTACGNKAENPAQYCEHIPKMKGMKISRVTASGGREEILIAEKCYGLAFFENSLLVEAPADPTAFVLGIEGEGVIAKVASKTSATDGWDDIVPASYYGLSYDARVAQMPLVRQMKDRVESGVMGKPNWPGVAVEALDVKSLVATSPEIARDAIEKFMDVPDPKNKAVKVLRLSDGRLVVLDGHHHIAKASAKGLRVDCQVIDQADAEAMVSARLVRASKTSMADRTGNPEIDRLIEDFIAQPGIARLVDGEVSVGMCHAISEEFVEFAEARGFKAGMDHVYLEEIGYQRKGPGAGLEPGFGGDHTVPYVHPKDGSSRWPFYVDFTATQYAYTDFPKVFSSKTASAYDSLSVTMPAPNGTRNGQVAALLGGKVIGHLQWMGAREVRGGKRQPDGSIESVLVQRPPQIVDLKVSAEHRRKGIATDLYRKAKEVEPDLTHDDVMLPDGEAWMDSLGSKTSATYGPVVSANLGRCYELSAKRVAMGPNGNTFSGYPGARLIHGTIQAFGNPPLEHAWVREPGGQTFWEPGTATVYSSADFAELFSPVVLHEYDTDEVRLLTATNGHWGPWEGHYYASRSASMNRQAYGETKAPPKTYDEGRALSLMPEASSAQHQSLEAGSVRRVLPEAQEGWNPRSGRAAADPSPGSSQASEHPAARASSSGDGRVRQHQGSRGPQTQELRLGARSRHGADPRQATGAGRGSPSQEPRQSGQSSGESGDLGEVTPIRSQSRGSDRMASRVPSGSGGGSALGYGEVMAPPKVDTLRDEACPVCGDDENFDGDRCQVCGYISPPDKFGDPDLEMAQKVDLRQEQAEGEDQVDVDGADAGVSDDAPLECDNCSTVFDENAPDIAPEEDPSGPTEDPKGSDGTAAEVVEQPEDEESSEADGAESDDEADEAEPDEADDPNLGHESDESDEESDVVVSEGDTCPVCQIGTLRAKSSQDPSTEEHTTPVAPGLDNVSAHMSKERSVDMPNPKIARNPAQTERNLLKRALREQQDQIDMLTKSLQAVVAGLNVQRHPRFASLMATADIDMTTEQAKKPLTTDDPDSEGATSGANDGVTPEAVTDVTQTTSVPSEPPINNLVDVTQPTAGTDSVDPNAVRHTNDGNNKAPSNEVMDPPGSTGWTSSSKEDRQERYTASLRLARLQIQAGLSEGEDLSVAEGIMGSEASLSEINASLATLASLVRKSASRQPDKETHRNLVPRAASGPPSLASKPIQSEAAAGDDSDSEWLFGSSV